MTTALVPTPEHKFAGKIKGYFLTGLLVLVPISLTVYIIYELFLAIDGILKDVIFVMLREWLGVHFSDQPIPGLGFITLFLLILGTGMAARSYFGKKLVDIGDRIVARIPFISRIYGTVQQISQAFFGERRDVFKKTVLVPFPSKGMWRIGFYIKETSHEIHEALGDDVVSVLVPHTPNPTSGFLVFFPKSEVIELDMPVEDALHLIVSGGTALPKRRQRHMMLTRDHLESLQKKTS
ncbi:MAG: DUF502 domain-containing protein [candidate division KSB1 bacterium]|nr:DUF502 domain-containing protein [candidate division KSB1 bacterium]MDZ7304754.1 DUF502 domain-containing protein [candidate division KSB1 bacterium]MDZ7314212.1 DUF502 domain-containing protein [candidate division KSB1 bacterium]